MTYLNVQKLFGPLADDEVCIILWNGTHYVAIRSPGSFQELWHKYFSYMEDSLALQEENSIVQDES